VGKNFQIEFEGRVAQEMEIRVVISLKTVLFSSEKPHLAPDEKETPAEFPVRQSRATGTPNACQ
jgi:hypothetical protein